jgi:hypothetical protein
MYIICPLYAQVFNVVFCPMSGKHSLTESEAARGLSFQCQGKECVEICRHRLIDKLDCIKNYIIAEMKTGRLEWLNHVIRLEDCRLLQKILNAKLDKNRKIGGTELRCMLSSG